jgi:hypothetical protein
MLESRTENGVKYLGFFLAELDSSDFGLKSLPKAPKMREKVFLSSYPNAQVWRLQFDHLLFFGRFETLTRIEQQQ